MDSFLAAANDLDRVLDEFEKNEESLDSSPSQPNWKAIPPHLQGTGNQYGVMSGSGSGKPDFIPSQPPVYVNGLSLEDVQRGDLTNGSMDGDQRSQSDASSGSELLIDLSEADFAPSAKPSLLLTALQESLASHKEPEQSRESPVPESIETVSLPPAKDSNTQLEESDISTYMSTNITRSLSISDLPNVDSAPSSKQENGLSSDVFREGQQHTLGNEVEPEQSEPDKYEHHLEDARSNNTMGSPSHSLNQGHKQEVLTVRNDLKSNEIDDRTDSLDKGDSHEKTCEVESVDQDSFESIQDSLNKTNNLEQDSGRSVSSVQTIAANKEEANTARGSPSNASITSSTSSVDSEAMQEYMRQGARPKVIGYRTPEQSPLKNRDESETPGSDTVNVKTSDKSPIVGFKSLTNVTVSQSELDELDASDAKPLAYDLSGNALIGQTSSDQGVKGLTPNNVQSLPDQETNMAPDRTGVHVNGQQMHNGMQPCSGNVQSSRNALPQEIASVPSFNSGSLSGVNRTLPISGEQQPGLLSAPDNVEDRVSPLSKILEQQYRLEAQSPTSDSNELANVDPFYGGKPQFESSTEDETVPDVLPKISDSAPALSNGTQHHQSAEGDVNSSLPAGSTIGFGISEESVATSQHSLGNHKNIVPQTESPAAKGDYYDASQSLPVSATKLQDLAPMQNVAILAGAPPQLSPAQPALPGMATEVAVEATLDTSNHGGLPQDTLENQNVPQHLQGPQNSPWDNSGHQNLPQDPPSYQQVEEATSRENHHISRQGLHLDFGLGGGELVNGHNQHQDGMDYSSLNPQFVAPPNVSLNPDHDNMNNFVPHHNGNIQEEHGVVENGDMLVSEALDPMTIQNNALNAQHMLPVPVQQNDQNNSVTGNNGLAVPGEVAPVWIPDSEAPDCMGCQIKFTFRKRRHHCRACGKVFCSKCCNVKVRLRYMDSKEGRVCVACLNAILTAEALERVRRQGGNTSTENSPGGSPAHALVAQPQPPTQAEAPNNTLQRSKSVLRRPQSDGSRTRVRRTVHFSDGTAPGMADSGESEDQSQERRAPSTTAAGDAQVMPETSGGRPQVVPTTVVPGDLSMQGSIPASIRSIPELQGGNRRRLQRQGWHKSLIPEDETKLPPVILTTEVKGEFAVDESPSVERILSDLRGDNPMPVVFVLSKNIMVLVQIVELNCCVNRTCWCFSSKGLATVGQDEVVIILECQQDEKSIPRDLFCHLYSLYEDAKRGNTVTDMGHTIFSGAGFLGSRDHGGFLYVRPTFQCLQKLILPEAPYLFAVLLQKWETPWAKVFPLRLLLRLGAEFRYYPCPLMSVRFRKPVFGEIGHTIMNLLADFKNYQYKLPVIRGVVIHMEDRQTVIRFPRNRYEELMKVLNNSNEHVMALAAVFSQDADSHLVCMQNDQGAYQTQAINIQNKPRKVTGASFVVFNGALKTSSGLTAKSSIVEDGLMVQIRPETMSLLKESMRQMQEMSIPCGSSSENSEGPEETVLVQWVDDDRNFNMGVSSPVDGRSLSGIESVRIHNSTEFHGHGHSRAIRWTEVFFVQNGLGDGESLGHPNVPEPVDLSRLAESLAAAFCLALSGSLNELRESGLVKLGLRVTVDVEQVGYEAGSKSQLLPPMYMNSLDNELIPVLHGAVSQHEGAPVVLELIFHIID